MKKKFMLVVLTLVLVLSCVGPIPAFASNMSTQSASQATPLADKYTYYFKTIDGKNYYRIWNNTDGRWETPWLPCP